MTMPTTLPVVDNRNGAVSVPLHQAGCMLRRVRRHYGDRIASHRAFDESRVERISVAFQVELAQEFRPACLPRRPEVGETSQFSF